MLQKSVVYTSQSIGLIKFYGLSPRLVSERLTILTGLPELSTAFGWLHLMEL